LELKSSLTAGLLLSKHTQQESLFPGTKRPSRAKKGTSPRGLSGQLEQQKATKAVTPWWLGCWQRSPSGIGHRADGGACRGAEARIDGIED